MDNIESLRELLGLLIARLRERVPQDGTEKEKMVHDPRFAVMARARLSVSGNLQLAVSQALETLLKLDRNSRMQR